MAIIAPLITKYRPLAFKEMVGHDSAIKSLQAALASRSQPHAYLFTGPSGLGKTTLARIIGKHLSADILEVDAASNNGIDNMRELVEHGQHMSLLGNGLRLIIIDECHALSRPAWQAILKLLEDPPQHLYLALCTTEFAKVPDTVLTRCFHVPLRPLSAPEMEDLLMAICDLEEWQVAADVFALVIQAATGQPRKGLTLLQAVHDAPDRDEARRVISLVEASDPLIELLQHLVSGRRSWKLVSQLLARIESDNWEETSIAAGRYIATVLVKTEEDKKAQMLWQMLEALVFPAETYDRKVAFIAAVGRVMWGGS